MPSTTRRAFLTAAATAAVAGCNTLRSRNDRAAEFTLTLRAIDGELADHALWEPPERDTPFAAVRREAWQAAVSGRRYTNYGYPAVPDGEYTEHDGTYYRLHDVVTGRERIERSVLRLTWVGDAEADDAPDATPRDALPPIDRNAVMPAYFAARAREYDGGAPWDVIEQGGFVYRHLDRIESELAPTPEHEYVAVHDTVLAVDVSQETLVEPAHTAVATRVATSAAEFGRVADAALVEERVSLSALGTETRELLGRVLTQEEYTESVPLSDAFETLLAELGFRDATDCAPDSCRDELLGRRYVAVDGDHYRASVSISAAD